MLTTGYAERMRRWARRCKCRQAVCEWCGFVQGEAIREQLLGVVDEWAEYSAWRLEIRKEGEPWAAFQRVRNERRVGRFVRELKRRREIRTGRYFAAVEYDRTGWPLFRVLLDRASVKRSAVERVWGLGKIMREDLGTARRAAVELTEGLRKGPPGGWPQWVMIKPGNVVRYSASRGLWREAA